MFIKRRYTNTPNFRLWFMLAMVPIITLIAVLGYITYAFDDGFILETDPTAGQESMAANNYERDFDNLADPLETSWDQEKTNSILDSQVKKIQKQESKKMEEIKIVEKRKIDKYGKPVQVRVQEGETLETMAERYFGNAVFWCYLQDVNADKIDEARGLKQGMALYLPDTAYYQIDSKDVRSVRKAGELSQKLKQEEEATEEALY